MERRDFLGALTAASIGIAFEGALSEFARAENTAQGEQALKPSSKTTEFPQHSTIILVHAAWADGSCWNNVVVPLQRHGLHVMCAPIPMTSLSDDAAALSRALERTSGPVVDRKSVV